MKTFLKNNFLFIVPYLLFLLLGCVLIILNTKAEKHLEFNAFHSIFFDYFFYYFTFLGDGLVAVLVTIILLTVKYRYALLVGVSNTISALITQFLKHGVFDNMVRPKKFFEGVHDLYFVPGVDNYLYNSFPSGHSTCAFCLYLSLSLILKNKMMKFVFFLIALLVGYSRVYLSQHFFEDVYAGSIIGVSVTLMVYYFLSKMNKHWFEYSLLNSFKS
ncbi:MAG: phosphatase PAP2 family protein [Bacteroidota bacterium]